MKYSYMVKCGGVYYAAGKEVPIPDEGSKASADGAVEAGDNDEAKKPGRPKKTTGR